MTTSEAALPTATTTRLIDPIADPEWLAFIEASPSAEIFHHPLWLQLLRSRYGYRIEACCVEGEGGIEAGIPFARIESRLTGRRLVSVPFSDSCATAVAANAGSAAVDALGQALGEESRRSGLDLTVHSALPEIPAAFVRPRFAQHLLPLAADPAEVERGYAKNQLRAMKKAKREGLSSERRTDVAALDAFYSLHLQTRRRQGVPTQPKSFIRGFAELFDAGLGFVWLVHDEGRPVAAAVFLAYNGTVTYKYGASDFASLKKRPNNLLLRTAIRWACEAGYQRFDFGRSDIDNEGLRAFKRSWGATESELSYTYVTDTEPSLQPEAEAETLRGRVMTTTIQRSPAFVGRLAGQVLYRHYG
jgi:CelD/BcsL family acetyltransferase involved in cellulose biosynthesis